MVHREAVVVHKGTKIATVEEMDQWMLAHIRLTETANDVIPKVPMHKYDLLYKTTEQCEVGLIIEETMSPTGSIC